MLLVFSSDLLYVFFFLSRGHKESFQQTHFGGGGGGEQMALMARECV